jgi:hypothetical protein
MIPGRVYIVKRSNVTIAAADTPQDFISISAPSTMVCVLLAAYITQSTRYSDANAEALRVEINRYASVGSGGASITPDKTQEGMPSATFTARGGDTTLGSTATLILPDSFHIQQGWVYEPTDTDLIIIKPSGVLSITLPADLPSATSISVSGRALVMEIG